MKTDAKRNNPPPRRKSCEACRAAKRRCDLALPACLRCARRNIVCEYPGLPAPDLMPEMLALLSEPQVSDVTCADQFTFASVPLLDPIALETHKTPIQPPVVYVDENHEMTHIRTKTRLPLPELMATRFQYAIDTLRDTPRMMVMENQTPWSHRELYSKGMPTPMQDAYACCALYITKTPINAPMVTTHIHYRHQALLLSPLPTSPPDLLAYTHALILYQIMHIFDPDLNNANTSTSLDALSMSALESAASLLFSSTHFPPSPDSNSDSTETTAATATTLLGPSLPATMHFWTLWISEESARRTILFTFYFLQILRLLRSEHNLHCDGKLGLLHSWYSSAHLWNADSAFDFALAWGGKEHFIVRNVDFSHLLEKAEPGDVDCFARMLLVSSQGLERVRGWFFLRGDIL
ncbi:hypothetical protein BDW59DRAFT_173722 [Aspergillus cavernicola]|uniref:Zn(2)-C6 fungal-type domain-containing protein n=1 Tax=Aspergillus cavernicola TaxID=176166 RepID=A0ABR4I583_9EURO